ncbi:hypothetical protein BDQ17DRAFT_1364004 [Cyathus striatus]|nr:hypothetical protein BDQ17DRAFT_1364004 [Cyathus striatus]
MLFLIKISFTSLLILETAHMLLSHPTPSKEITPRFLLGWFLNLLGGRIRKASYNALGDYFTFEIGTHKEHKLITTGPYAYVRHPSYTGLVTGLLGCLLVFNTCVWIPRIIWIAACGASAFIVVVTFYRVAVEDDMLRRRFGDDWVKWRVKK